MLLTSSRASGVASGVVAGAALAATVTVYLTAPVAWWLPAVAGPALTGLAFTAHLAGHRRQSEALAAIAIAMVPTAMGWRLATPPVGALVLGAVLWRTEGRTLWARPDSRVAIAAALGVVAGVALFATLREPESAVALSWAEPARPNVGIGLVAAGVLGASVVNGLFEELMWRVAMLDLLRSSAPSLVWAVAVSAAFGLVHLHGTPGGWVGVCATFAFALAMLGLRRLSSGSIVLCVAVHVAADVIVLGRLYA